MSATRPEPDDAGGLAGIELDQTTGTEIDGLGEGATAGEPGGEIAGRSGPDTERARSRQHRLESLIVGLLLISVAAAGSVYLFLYRPDQLTDESARQVVLQAASEGTEALLSYSPDTVQDDVAAAKARLTGDFLTRYGEFADTVVTPAAQDRGITTEANVARAAVASMRPEEARVLVFVNQVTTSAERPTPALATSSVIVTLVRDGGRWLISDFSPI